VVGWWYISNIKAIMAHGGYPFMIRTNSIGVRSDHEYPLKRPLGRHRALVIGDSYTQGWGVNNGERWSDYLEKEHPKLDTMNFALTATGTDQQLLIYESIAKPYEADLYILAPCTNNILRNIAEFGPRVGEQYRSKPYFTLDDGSLVLHNVPVPNKLAERKDALEKLSFRSNYRATLPEWVLESSFLNKLSVAVKDPYEDYKDKDSKSWQLMRAIIQRFIQQVDRKPVFILPLPTVLHSMRGPTYLSRFRELQDSSENCYLIDVLPYFSKLSSDDLKRCRFPNDAHYSALGHKIVAKAVSDALSEYTPELAN